MFKQFSGWVRNHFVTVLIISAIVAMAISLSIGLKQSIWFDESYSILVAKSSFSQLFHLTAIDTHPPLFYIVLKLWGGVFGWSEFALRSLPVLLLGGSVISAGLLVRRMFGVRAALIALLFVVFAPFLLRYGFEVRMYSMASLIGIVATYALVSALESKSKKQRTTLFVLYAILVAVGVYTLYYTVLLWLAHFVWLVWRARSNKEKIIKSQWFAAYILSIILFLPYLITFIKQITNGALAPISQSMTFENLSSALSFSVLYRPVWQLDKWLSLVMVFVVIAITYITIKAFISVDKSKKQYLVLLCCYWIVPIGILALVGLFKPMYVERYLAHILIGFSLLVGVAASIVLEKPKRVNAILVLLVLGSFLIGVANLNQSGNYNYQRMQRTETKQLASIVRCDDAGVALVDDPYFAVEFSYYLNGCRTFFYSQSDNLGGGYAPISNKGNGILNPRISLGGYDAFDHVYYGKTDLDLPLSSRIVSVERIGNLMIDHYSR